MVMVWTKVVFDVESNVIKETEEVWYSCEMFCDELAYDFMLAVEYI